MRFGVLGSGSWATALAKILTDNGNSIHWWVRNEATVKHILNRHHNPNYLSSIYFDSAQLKLSAQLEKVVHESDHLVVAIPSAYIHSTFESADKKSLEGKSIISAVKGIIPEFNLLLNDYMLKEFGTSREQYYTIIGPCYAEEIAAEKLSYLTFSGSDELATEKIASCFKTDYTNTVVNTDVYGVQFAAILKNIYALGAGIAHGLEYGDNFLSVYIANCADEMAGFLRKVGIRNVEVGVHTLADHRKSPNYAASVYLGDLLVTCYSLFSRNRTFGNMIGKGYSVRSAQLELNMVAEGYYACKCIHAINAEINAEIPIVETVYRILWEHVSAATGFLEIEDSLV